MSTATRSSLPADPTSHARSVAKHGLTPEEFERIKKILGREPNFTELGIFSVMWSEHCSYKNSRTELKKFPTTGPNILVKAGEENAGVVDIGDGWAVAFKIESHNHPERDRAVPRRGHRRRRNHSRHLHHGSAAGVLAEFAALRADHEWRAKRRTDRSTTAGCSPACRRHRALRELHRRSDHRRRDLFRRKFRGQSARQCFLPRRSAA